MNFLRHRGLKVGVLMLIAAGMAFAARPREKVADTATEKINLEVMVPKQFGDWKVDANVVPIALNPELKAVVEKTYDQTLSRTYVNVKGERIMLSIAYGSNQNSSMQIHRPEVCYPAQGFKVLAERTADILLDYGRLPIKRLFAVQGLRMEPVTYWLVVGDQVSSFGMQHRLDTLRYGLTGSVPDGMLVRISSIGPDSDATYRVQDNFIKNMLTALNEKDRVRLLGTLGA